MNMLNVLRFIGLLLIFVLPAYAIYCATDYPPDEEDRDLFNNEEDK